MTSSAPMQSHLRLMMALCPAIAVSNTLATAVAIGIVIVLAWCTSAVCASMFGEKLSAPVATALRVLVVTALIGCLSLLMDAALHELRGALGVFLPLVAGSFALLCRALMGHATVGAALREAQRGFNLFFDDVQVELEAGDGRARLVLHNRIEPAALRRFADETLLVMLHGLMCWLAGRRVPLRAARFAWPRPAHFTEYRRMFGAALSFCMANSTPRKPAS